MSTAELAQKALTIVAESPEVKRRSLDFEMAYQARVASDRIRFAIRRLESDSASVDGAREVSMQLLDALDRLESVERRFQAEWRRPTLDRGTNGSHQHLERVAEDRL